MARTASHRKSVISEIRYKHLPNLENLTGGHPALLSPANKRHARHLITSGKSETAAGAARALQDIINHPVSPITVRRALIEQGLKAVTKKKKALLSAKHGKARLDFANSYKDWTIDGWKRVIWSDEMGFSRFGRCLDLILLMTDLLWDVVLAT